MADRRRFFIKYYIVSFEKRYITQNNIWGLVIIGVNLLWPNTRKFSECNTPGNSLHKFNEFPSFIKFPMRLSWKRLQRFQHILNEIFTHYKCSEYGPNWLGVHSTSTTFSNFLLFSNIKFRTYNIQDKHMKCIIIIMIICWYMHVWSGKVVT